MNESSTEEMQYMIKKSKALFEASMKERIIIIGAGHQDITQINLAQRIENAAAKLSTKFLVVTADEIKSCAANTKYSVEQILDLIDGLSRPRPEEDLKNLKFTAPALVFEREYLQSPIIDHDDRPFYLKVSDQGGRKRKQRYYNKQRW